MGGVNLDKNRGFVVISQKLLTENPEESFLKAIFSDFFPIAIEPDHTYGMYGKIRFYGYSKHFREVPEGETIPEYLLTVTQTDGEYRFERLEEVKPFTVKNN